MGFISCYWMEQCHNQFKSAIRDVGVFLSGPMCIYDYLYGCFLRAIYTLFTNGQSGFD